MSEQGWFALSGAIPALVALAYVDWLDRKRPEPRWTLRLMVLAGMVAVVPVIVIELWLGRFAPPPDTWRDVFYQSFVVAAFTEECAKAACVWIFVWRRAEFDERLDGIVYGAHAALGLALIENVGYLWAVDHADYVSTFIGRAVLTVPGHALWGSIMGYFAAARRFDGVGPGLLGGLALAVLMHGLFDVGLFGYPLAEAHGNEALASGLVLIPLAVIIGNGVWVRAMARRALLADDREEILGRFAR